MEFPTKLYPSPPVLADFRRTSGQVRSLTQAPGTSGTTHPDSLSYQIMDATDYSQYTAAHQTWLLEIRSIQDEEHTRALRRRFLDKYKEDLTPLVPEGFTYTKKVKFEDYTSVLDDSPLVGVVNLERKTEHVPVLSKKPYADEKRKMKKQLADARTWSKVQSIEARHKTIAKDTSAVIEKRIAQVKEVTDLKPLRKAELAAAKSAAARATHIKKSSPDLVTEVKPDDGWKIVTRKKGDTQQCLGSFTSEGKTTQLMADPSLVSGRSFAAAIRQPTSTGGR